MGPAMDRTDVEVARFEVAEAAFGVAEALVGADDGGGGEAVLGKIASDHIDAVERGFGREGLGLARPGEACIGDGEFEMFGRVATIEHRADPETDPRDRGRCAPG